MALVEVRGKLADAVEFGESTAVADILAAQPAAIPGFSPIGIGKPLTLAIEHVYVGRLPKIGTLFKHQPDVLLTSAAKALQQFDSAPRAINRLSKKVDNRTVLEFTAPEDGTPLVYYRNAMADETTTVTIEMVADSFSQVAFDQISKLTGQAAGIPIFAPASTYLLAGSVIAKVVGALGEKLIDGRPFFSSTLQIRFDTPGWEITQPRKALLNPTGTDSEFLGYEFPEDGYEIVKDGVPYAGDVPYVAVRIDGKLRPEYKDFGPKAVSSALMSRFFHLDQGGEAAESLMTALELYNDLQFAKRAGEVKKTLDGLTAGDPARTDLQNRYDALVKNIRDDRFKPA